MVGIRVALLGPIVAFGLPGCVVAPQATNWSHDLAAAKASAAGAGGLVVVHFTVPGQRESDAMTRALDAASEVRGSLAHHRAVRLVAAAHARAFRDVFDTRPDLATCVMDGRGLVLAARLGSMPPAEFVRFVRQAEDAHPVVASLAADLEALPMRGPRAAQRSKAFLLAEAYLVSGNPFAACEYYTLVTLLDPTTEGSRTQVLRACERLARIEIERGNHREAREWLGHLEEKSPETAARRSSVQLTEAMIALAERRAEDAHAILTTLRADESNAEADRIWFEYGRACHESGRDQDARRAFSTVLSRFPDSRWRAAAAAELAHSGTTHRHDNP